MGDLQDRPGCAAIDSEQLESGEAMSDEFKRMAATEIEEFKAEYRTLFPGRDADELTDEDLLREVMNTVGKKGKLGEQIRCVVSVSMLTEGWDANTVTHILGVRAFGTQLLCEQVSVVALRRVKRADGRLSRSTRSSRCAPVLPSSRGAAGPPFPVRPRPIPRVRHSRSHRPLITLPRLGLAVPAPLGMPGWPNSPTTRSGASTATSSRRCRSLLRGQPAFPAW
jgi:hypothetical protein